jgi:hypothetical protein
MKVKLLATALFCASVFGASAHASTVTPNTWQTVTTPVTISGEVISSSINSNGTSSAYWNNGTHDGSNCLNVGCFVTKSGGFSSNASSPALTNPVYLGNANGSAFADFTLNGGGSSTPITMLAEVAGNASRNWFGWYDATITSSSQLTDANRGTLWDVVFNGLATTGSSVIFTPTATFGFWMGLVPTGSISASQIQFLTESTLQTGDTSGNQHFAMFARSTAAANALPAQFWLGVEDLPLGGADRDYNDMIVSFQVVAVPEPGSMALIAIALAGVVVTLRRKESERGGA